MRVVSLGFVLVMIILASMSFNNGGTKEVMLSSLEDVHNSTFMITENNFTYTNLYVEAPTPRNVMYNVLHGIAYGVLVEIHTVVPVLIYGAADTNILFRIGVLILCLWLLTKIFVIMYGSVALWFFVKEKRRYDEKVWE